MDEPSYAQADDTGLTQGCLGGDAGAWRELRIRHGRLMEAIVVRVIDERRGGKLEEAPQCLYAVHVELEKNDGKLLRGWGGASTLRHFVAVVTRQIATTYLQDVTPPARSITFDSPAEHFLDDLLAPEPAKEATDAIDRMSPQIPPLVRLRLRGLGREAITATLKMPAHTALGGLELVARRLGEMHGKDVANTTQAWRILLDVATLHERVEVALRTEDDEQFRRTRERAEATWDAIRLRALDRLYPRAAGCLDELAIAAFVDGSMRGADRARAEGHVSTCARCIDSVATLTMDMRAHEILRDTNGLDQDLAIAAACMVTGRSRAGEVLATRALERGVQHAQDLVRLAQLGQAVRGERSAPESSRVIPTQVPTDEEAPLVAMEALAADDPSVAARAIDDLVAKQPLAARLRLLACIAGYDLQRGKKLAAELHGKAYLPPEAQRITETALALPADRPLPREILIERLRDAIPEAVRLVLRARSL